MLKALPSIHNNTFPILFRYTRCCPQNETLKFSRVPGISVRFSKIWRFLADCFETPNPILHVICSAGAVLLHADRRTHITDEANRYFLRLNANEPNNPALNW